MKFLINSWLHFIFDDRITNDLKAAQFRLINRKHRLAYLPPILHDYEYLITDKFDVKPEDNVTYYRHVSSDDLILAKNGSFEEMPTIRSDLEFTSELTESKINELYAGYNIQPFNSKEEEEEVKRLKSLLLENYVPENEIKVEKVSTIE